MMKRFIIIALCCFLTMFVFLNCSSKDTTNSDGGVDSVEQRVDIGSLGEEINISIREEKINSLYAETEPAIMVIKNINGFDMFANKYLNYDVSDVRPGFEESLNTNYILAAFMGKKPSQGFAITMVDKAHLSEGKLYISAKFKVPMDKTTEISNETSPYVMAEIEQSYIDSISSVVLYDNKTSIIKSINDFSFNVFE